MTATGKIKRGHSMKRHILTKKAAGRKRKLRNSTLVIRADAPNIEGCCWLNEQQRPPAAAPQPALR